MSTSPFPLPVMFTAWEWHNGAGIAGKVINAAKLGGFKTVAVQLSEDTGGDPGSTLDRQDVEYLKQAGLFVVGWDPVGAGTSQQIVDLGCDGWMPQVEGPAQRDALLAFLRTTWVGTMPRALVTTYGGLDTLADEGQLANAWGGNPFTFVECYKADGSPHNDISRMLAQGQVYGFPADSLRALIGTYRGEMPSDYIGLTPANYGGIYLEENTTDAQLQAFAALATAPTPAPNGGTVTVDPAALNAQIAKLAEQYPDGHPLSRLNCIDDIATSDDATWNQRRQDVRDALDGKIADLRDELAHAQAQIAAAQKDLAA